MALTYAASSEDLIALLRHHLLSDSGVADIAGGRIHGAHLQDYDSQTVAYPIVVMELEGGFTTPTGGYQSSTVYIYAYDRDSQGNALRLYDKVHAALQHQLLRRDGVGVAGYCRETVRPDFGWNERARAWYARGLWSVRVGYRQV